MRVHHIALRTRDLARLVHFYESILGLRRIDRGAAADETRSVWLRAGQTIVMLERADDDEPGVVDGSMDLLAFAIEEPEAERWRRVLASCSVPIESETAYTIYFRDPDGRRVALSHY